MFIIISIIFILVNIVNSLYRFWKNRIQKIESINTTSNAINRIMGLPPRRTNGNGKKILVWNLYLGFFLLYAYNKEGFDLSQIGVKTDVPELFSFLVGILIYLFFVLIWTYSLKLTDFLELIKDANFNVLRSIWPRNKIDKLSAIMGICILNPIIEETLSRGVLVYWVGNYFNLPLFGIVLGLIVNLLVHIYQGYNVIIFHILFYIIAVSILYSPLGLIGIFGFHFAGDFYPVLRFRHSMKEWVIRNKSRIHKQVRSAV